MDPARQLSTPGDILEQHNSRVVRRDSADMKGMGSSAKIGPEQMVKLDTLSPYLHSQRTSGIS
jgi:hypothetical protein